MNIRQRLGLNVRKYRTAMGISQEELAHRANVHRTYCSDIERGTRNPSIDIVERFAEALNVRAGTLLD